MQLAFPLTTYHDRVARVRETARAQGLDAVVVTLPDAIHWLTGFDTIGYLWSQALVVDHADGEPVLHTRTTEQPGVEATTWLTAPKLYDIATEDPTEGLAATLRERGHASGRVGLDLRSFAFLPAQWEQMKRLLPEVEWVDTTDLVAELRLVKTERELAYQREAAAIADAAMHATMAALRPGISEVELAGVAAAALGAGGSEYAAIPPMVVSGPRTGMVHAMASRRILGPGMSFSLEPNLTLADEGFGIKIGETVVCTERGAERLSAVDLALTEVA